MPLEDYSKVAVTGAFSHSGRFIARKMLDMGKEVITITGHPRTDEEFGDKVPAYPFDFSKPERLAETLAGCDMLVNTYWVRYPSGGMTFEQAVENSRSMFYAAKAAGVKRIVHLSVANCDPTSRWGYYRGKAEVEKALSECGVEYSIIRPIAIFGPGGVLINNIAWFLKNMPVFGIPGDGKYGMQPVHIDDLVNMVVDAADRESGTVRDAVGPDAPTFNELLKRTKKIVNGRALLVHMAPEMALAATKVIGKLKNDVVLTNDEVGSLLANLLVSREKPTCPTSLFGWMEENADWLGKEYMNDSRP